MLLNYLKNIMIYKGVTMSIFGIISIIIAIFLVVFLVLKKKTILKDKVMTDKELIEQFGKNSNIGKYCLQDKC